MIHVRTVKLFGTQVYRQSFLRTVNFHVKMGRGIPDRWQEYSKIGKPMKSAKLKTRFLSFKVPLKPQLTQSLEESETFSPADLIAKCRESNINLGLVIDLTFTKRYYSPNDFTSVGIKYVKIPVEGQMVPKRARLEQFTKVVEQHMERNKDKDKVIGVHCTHGVNRTGYLICKYLIQQEGMNPEEAIKLFNTCRGHEMEREVYLHNLRTDEIPESEKRTYEDGEYDAPQWQSNKTDYQQNREQSHRYQYNDYGRQRGYDWNHYNRYDSRPSPYDRYEPYGDDSYHHDSYYYESYHRDSYRKGRYSDRDYRDTQSSAEHSYNWYNYNQAAPYEDGSNRAGSSNASQSNSRKRRRDNQCSTSHEPSKPGRSDDAPSNADGGASAKKSRKVSRKPSQ